MTTTTTTTLTREQAEAVARLGHLAPRIALEPTNLVGVIAASERSEDGARYPDGRTWLLGPDGSEASMPTTASERPEAGARLEPEPDAAEPCGYCRAPGADVLQPYGSDATPAPWWLCSDCDAESRRIAAEIAEAERAALRSWRPEAGAGLGVVGAPRRRRPSLARLQRVADRAASALALERPARVYLEEPQRSEHVAAFQGLDDDGAAWRVIVSPTRGLGLAADYLVAHEVGHAAQAEAAERAGLDFWSVYASQVRATGYEVAPLEAEARAIGCAFRAARLTGRALAPGALASAVADWSALPADGRAWSPAAVAEAGHRETPASDWDRYCDGCQAPDDREHDAGCPLGPEPCGDCGRPLQHDPFGGRPLGARGHCRGAAVCLRADLAEARGERPEAGARAPACLACSGFGHAVELPGPCRVCGGSGRDAGGTVARSARGGRRPGAFPLDPGAPGAPDLDRRPVGHGDQLARPEAGAARPAPVVTAWRILDAERAGTVTPAEAAGFLADLRAILALPVRRPEAGAGAWPVAGSARRRRIAERERPRARALVRDAYGRAADLAEQAHGVTGHTRARRLAERLEAVQAEARALGVRPCPTCSAPAVLAQGRHGLRCSACRGVGLEPPRPEAGARRGGRAPVTFMARGGRVTLADLEAAEAEADRLDGRDRRRALEARDRRRARRRVRLEAGARPPLDAERARRILRHAEQADPTGIRGGAAAGASEAEERRTRAAVAEARRALGLPPGRPEAGAALEGAQAAAALGGGSLAALGLTVARDAGGPRRAAAALAALGLGLAGLGVGPAVADRGDPATVRACFPADRWSAPRGRPCARVRVLEDGGATVRLRGAGRGRAVRCTLPAADGGRPRCRPEAGAAAPPVLAAGPTWTGAGTVRVTWSAPEPERGQAVAEQVARGLAASGLGGTLYGPALGVWSGGRETAWTLEAIGPDRERAADLAVGVAHGLGLEAVQVTRAAEQHAEHRPARLEAGARLARPAAAWRPPSARPTARPEAGATAALAAAQGRAGRARLDRPGRVTAAQLRRLDRRAADRAEAVRGRPERRAVAALERAARAALAARLDAADGPTWTAGAAWYPAAARAARRIAARTGLPPERVAAAVAVLSPRKHWAANLRAAVQVAEAVADGRPAPPVHFPRLVGQAERVLTGDLEPAEAATGPKVSRFFAAITGDPEAVTLDVHAVRACGVPEAALQRRHVRAALERAYTAEAEARGIAPRDLQAVAWIAERGAVPSDPADFVPDPEGGDR
jgi:hypothetical protein